MGMAVLAAQRSTHPETRIGCCIGTGDGIVLGHGCNGSAVSAATATAAKAEAAAGEASASRVTQIVATGVWRSNPARLHALRHELQMPVRLLQQDGEAELAALCVRKLWGHFCTIAPAFLTPSHQDAPPRSQHLTMPHT